MHHPTVHPAHGRRRPEVPGRGALLAALLAASLATALLAGCAGTPPPPRAGYDRRVDSLGVVDPSVLAGKRVVLDPGHGGFFRGALGVHGLTEAEVNLGVALELARLLRSHGAEVLLTREIDRDYLTPADSSLRSDLTERVRMANAFHPDLFVSIHHNADPSGSHQVNETRVYYQLGDDGPSLDAAADVHRFLARNLGIEKSRVVAGNYAVLRGSESPALLTESSYITYPPTEKKLAGEPARTLEAEALSLGITAWFARKAPVVEEFRVWAPGTSPGDSVIASTPLELRARVRGAFDAVEMAWDGTPVTPTLDGAGVAWRPPGSIEPGPHEATLRVRLAGEGSSRLARLRFATAISPSRILAEFPDQPVWDGIQPLGLRVLVLSAEGLPVRDSLAIRVRDDRSGLLSPADTVITLRDGVAWAYFRRSSLPVRERAPSARLRVELVPLVLAGVKVPLLDAARPALAFAPRLLPPVRTGFALRMPEGLPLRDAPGTREPSPALRWINRDGFVRLWEDSAGTLLPHDAPSSAHAPALRGYRPWASDTLMPPRFVAIAGGALHGRRIVVDPAGGGDDDAGRGPSGARGAALNLEVARALASMLEAAGADVKLTRAGDEAVSDLARVAVSERFHADRYLRIGHGAEPPRLGSYFSSAAGKRWASRLAGIAGSLGLPVPRTGDDAQYPIQQASATALYASLGRVDDTSAPLGRFDPARLRLEAYALYLGLAREWATDAEWPVDSLEVVDEAGRPLAGAPVRLGGALVLQADALGGVRFARTEAGPMMVAVEDSRLSLSRILLDFDRAVRLTGPVNR